MPAARETPNSALLTGASSGIGLAIAAMLAEEGFALTLVARRPGPLEEAREKLAAAGVAVETVAADVSDPEVGADLVADHVARWGGLDLLVNNAGVGIAQPVGEIGLRALDLQTRLNFLTPVMTCSAALDPLRASAAAGGPALIVNVASLSGKLPQGGITAYSATKAAIVAFTEGMNREVSGEGIRATAICPGYVDTPMTKGAADRGVDLGAMIAPADCAELVRALLRTSSVALVPEIVIRQAGRSY